VKDERKAAWRRRYEAALRRRSDLAAIAGFALIALLVPQAAALAAIASLAVIAFALIDRRSRPRAAAGPVTVQGPLWGEGAAGPVLEAMTDPVLIVDRALFIRFCNRAAVQTFGTVAPGEPVTLRFRTPEVAMLAREVFADSIPCETIHREGRLEERVWSLSISPIREDRPGSTRYALFTFRDRTAEHQAARMRSDFVANASHELRTPLASLIGFIETLEGPARDDREARTRFLSIMRDQAGRMSRLIDDLLSLSRIETRPRLGPGDEADLVAVLSTVRALMEPLAAEAGVELELDTDGHDSFLVEGDGDELVRVFVNLVENACRYAASGKRVIIDLSAVGENEVEAEVRDFGPGIASRHLPRLTERFYRVAEGDPKARDGTGLGLSIVRNILIRHGTRLRIESVEGKGSTFSARFRRKTDMESI
jgi:two-component system, OmpR family, phosphate regulon sensor histidine kinase PhoR